MPSTLKSSAWLLREKVTQKRLLGVYFYSSHTCIKMCGSVCVYHVSPRQCDKMGAVCSPLDSPTRCTDDTIHFERASCREKQCTVSGKGSKMCKKFTEDAAVLPRNVHMLRRTWERLPYQQQGNNTQQHIDHHSTNAGSWGLLTCPPYPTLSLFLQNTCHR